MLRSASRPYGIAPSPSSALIYHCDAAVGAAVRGQVEFRLRCRLAVLPRAHLHALPPIAARGQRDRTDVARLDKQPIAVHDQLAERGSLRREVMPSLHRGQQRIGVEAFAMDLNPPAEAVFRVIEVCVITRVDQQPVALLEKRPSSI